MPDHQLNVKKIHKDVATSHQTFRLTRPMSKVLKVVNPKYKSVNVDLTGRFRILDQMRLGSCVCNSWVSLFSYSIFYSGKNLANTVYLKQFGNRILSRLFLYYFCRVNDSISPNTDSGLTIVSPFNQMKKEFPSFEAVWPYIVDKFKNRPNAEAINNGKLIKAELDSLFGRILYARLTGDIKTAIFASLNLNKPVIFGIDVYSSFYNTGKNGIVPLPIRGDSYLGGHCLLCVGATQQYLIFLNSWSAEWGKGGYGYLPWTYVAKYAFDFYNLSFSK